jgi:lipopolysaccharide export system permease protein
MDGQAQEEVTMRALGRASILRRYLVQLFLPSLAASLGLFALVLELVDLFGNLWRYLAQDAPFLDILKVIALYLPTALSNGLPIALLFATAYSLAALYASNELTVIFGSGVSLASFTAPVFAIAALLCVGSFFFDDSVVLLTLKAKNDLSRVLLKQSESMSNPDVTVISRDGEVVYRAQFYDDAGRSLSGVTVMERDPGGAPRARTEAAVARWDGKRWVFATVRRFERTLDGAWTELSFGSWTSDILDEKPEAFRSLNKDLGELSSSELSVYVRFLRRAGLPYAGAMAEKHKRFSFAFTPLIVVLLAGSSGGRFRKNVLLASLLMSLVAATMYYVAQMITMLLAKTGAIDPRIGAWAPFVVFSAAGVLLFRTART